VRPAGLLPGFTIKYSIMQEVFIVYKTDVWHSYASRELLGIGTTQAKAIDLCIQQAKKEGHTIPKEELSFLADKNQTQDYSGEGEFVIEPIKTNTLY
jgi:hypothetical protein